MYKSKLIDIFRTLTKHELAKLGIYIEAQTDVLKDDIVWLYQIVKKNYANATSPKLHRQFVINHLYSNLPPQKAEADWRRLMTSLTKVIESFLVWQEINKEELLLKVFLLRVYSNKGLDNMFEEEFGRLTQPIDKGEQYELHNLLYLFLIEEELYNKKSLTQEANGNKNIDMLLERLDIHYIVSKLQIMCDLYSGRNFLPGSSEKPWLLDEILAYIKQHPHLEEHPFVAIYYRILLMQIEPSKQRYRDFLDYLQKHEHNFTPTLVHDLYFYALNYCGQQINLGSTDYHKDMFEVYEKFYNKKNTYKIKIIIKEEFKNVVTVCIRLDEIEFAENFIARYSKYLNDNDKKIALNATLADLHIYKKEYSKSLGCLYKIKGADPFTELNARVSILKCYYELKEMRMVETSLDSSTAFLRNQKIPDNSKWSYKVFFKYLRKLAKIREEYFKQKAEKDIAKLKLEMEQENLTVFAWIYQKVVALYDELHR